MDRARCLFAPLSVRQVLFKQLNLQQDVLNTQLSAGRLNPAFEWFSSCDSHETCHRDQVPVIMRRAGQLILLHLTAFCFHPSQTTQRNFGLGGQCQPVPINSSFVANVTQCAAPGRSNNHTTWTQATGYRTYICHCYLFA